MSDKPNDQTEVKNSVEIPLAGQSTEAGAKKPPWLALKKYVNAKNVRRLLKIGQVLIGVVILALIRPRNRCGFFYNHQGIPEYVLIMLTYMVTVITLVLLVDSFVKGQPIRKVFTLDLWSRLELWFTGLAALVLHIVSYFVLALNVNCPYASPNWTGTSFGLVASGLYLADWWRVFSDRKQPKQDEGFEEINITSS
ncbi:uncharacterized protein LOC135711469 [Ochlerotatus camptorhynchus]|uniref:uncharacterized protein LOC135711469 n=1 Tax=Ochlerotatus camptorhynchus TaxID=644619 RepID=UPI0031D5E8F1